MANEWLRLWHDMPTDPKWRTISRASGEAVSLVQAVYLHMLVDASRNVTRGHVDVTAEDLASALDVTEEQIRNVLAAMEGRVIADGALSGWDRRQPKKEDHGNPSTGAKSPAERKREERARKASGVDVTTGHDESRDVTTDKDKEEDKELDIAAASRDAKKPKKRTSVRADFRPEGEGLAAAIAAGLNVEEELRRFIDHHEAKGSTMASWPAAWRTWVSNAVSFGKGKPGTAAKGDTSWLAATGFETVAEAQNHRCHIGNAHLFRNGHRLEVAA